MNNVLAIDFDGVIHDHKHPIAGKRMGEPINGAQDMLRRLKAQGYTIVVHTVWGHPKGKYVVADWLNFYGMPYDEITNEKPQADVYLDDKAVRFTTWEEFEEQLVSARKSLSK